MRTLPFLLLALAFTVATIFCVTTESLSHSFEIISALNWGKLMLIDLYLGFLVFAALVFYIEKSFLKAIAWLTPCLIFGNSISLIYIFFRLFKQK